MMTKVLFVTWDGGGNLPPALSIAEELVARGDTVLFLGHESQRAAVERAGLAFTPYRHARSWSVVDPRSGPTAALAYAGVFTDRGMGTDVVKVFQQAAADRLVIDGLLIGAMKGATDAGIPYTVLVHTLRSVMTRTLEGGPLGMIMKLRGLSPRRQYRVAEKELVTALPVLDAAVPDTPASALYTGPILPEVQADRPVRTPSAPPVILVSLSTTYIAGQQKVLQSVLDATSHLPVRVVVTTGPAVDPSALSPSANATVQQFVPHGEIMPSASLVIGHGGHGTTMLALAHGVPLLVLPMAPTFDQPAIGRAVADHGAGLTLRKTAGVERIQAAVEEVLRNPRYRTAAEDLGKQIRAHRGAALAADALQARSGAVR